MQLSFTGGRSGNPTFGNAAMPTGCNISTSGQISRATEGVCHVSAYDAPETSNSLCIVFGDLIISDANNCTAQPATPPSVSISSTAQTVNAPGTVTVTAELSRPLKTGESVEIYPLQSVGACLTAGEQTLAYLADQSRNSHSRAFTCTQDATVQYKAVVNSPAGTVEETLCVRYGLGSENAQCPSLSYVAPDEDSGDSGQIDFEVAGAYPLDERITLTATNAGESPSWIVQRTPIYNSRLGYADSNLVNCDTFVASVPTEREIQVRYYPAICQVTLRHTDDTSNQVTKCLAFGDVNVPSNQQAYVSSVCGADF